jgi:hypothetical protein
MPISKFTAGDSPWLFSPIALQRRGCNRTVKPCFRGGKHGFLHLRQSNDKEYLHETHYDKAGGSC